MRTYTVDGKQYTGFNHGVDIDSKYVVIILDEGEHDCYSVDDPKKVGNLVSFFADHRPNALPVGVYTRNP